MTSGALQWLRRCSAAAAGLLAMLALYKMEGTSVALPIWAGIVLVACIVPARLPDTPSILWLIRIPVIGFAVLANMSRTIETFNMFDVRSMTWFGEICAAELALSCWMRDAKDRPAIRPLWLSGLVMLAASCTPDDTFMFAIAPAYFLALLVAIRLNEALRTTPRQSRIEVPWRYAIALIFALACGAGISFVLNNQRSAITAWGMQLLGEHIPFESGALSTNSTLTSTFGQRGSLTRALRIDGDGEFSHMRGIAYTTYREGGWGPRRVERLQEDQISTELDPLKSGNNIQVTRLLNNHGIVFSPLSAAGIRFLDNATVFRSNSQGGMLHTSAAAPSAYDITLSADDAYQGPLCTPLTNAGRKLMLYVPDSVDPRVRELADAITKGIVEPRRRVLAIEQYLLSHYEYSLRVDIGRGDPLSNFLLQRKAAHCEYFASAAAILTRLAGVPSRYVIGYLAHEREGSGTTIVRQRDAHAWAECWIDGTGWITVDATPGSGRPDALQEKPSPLVRAYERLQDMITAVRLGAYVGVAVKIAAGLLGAAAIAAAARGAWTLLRARRRRSGRFAYTQSRLELRALFHEFERGCRARGLVCPPSQTWLDFVEARDRTENAGPQLEAARAFLFAYNAARFGKPDPSGDLSALRRLLAAFQNARTAAASLNARRR